MRRPEREGKAGNGNETETRTGNWKLEMEIGNGNGSKKTHQSLVQFFLHSVLSA